MMCVTPYFHPRFKILCPCRKCLPCVINRKRTWTTRAIFELMAHNFSTFLTLTYDDDHNTGSLSSRDLTLFWKKMRKKGCKFRYFACGEYGEKSYRPHYHAIIYGEDSAIVEHYAQQCWDKGFIYSVPATPETAGYVAGYVTKKMADRSELLKLGLEPEFIRCSKGIGKFILPILLNYSNLQGEFDIIHKIKIGGKDYPLPDYLRSKLRELVYDKEYIEFLKLSRIKDMQDTVIGLLQTYENKNEVDDIRLVLSAVKKHTANDLKQLNSKDKIWNSRSKI